MSPVPVAAAQYLRMSSEHQRYSLHNQAQGIAAYAAANGYQLVRSYYDPGRSGLTLRKRIGLQALLSDALQPDRQFEAVLVFDVTRWGRFQDLDQSAHYEFICRQAGVAVIYCAEAFANDGSASAALVKELKRLMAAEYSRELSRKVAAAKRLQAQLGFRMGGPLIFGVDRVLLDVRGRPRVTLQRGVHKAQADERVILTHGPQAEVKTVRRIFRRFVADAHTPSEIARELNREGVAFIGRRLWSRDAVVRLLRHELMIGVYTYNRTSHRLQGRLVERPPAEWVRVKVFDPIVPLSEFRRAQARLGAVRRRQSPHQMLLSLKSLLQAQGRLSAALIDADPLRQQLLSLLRELEGRLCSDRLFRRGRRAERGAISRAMSPLVDGRSSRFEHVIRQSTSAWEGTGTREQGLATRSCSRALRARGARVSFVCGPELVSLLGGQAGWSVDEAFAWQLSGLTDDAGRSRRDWRWR